MKNLRPLGIVLLVLGIFFFAINYSMITSGGFYMRKLFGASIFMIVLGLGTTICKGADLTDEEAKLLDQDDDEDDKNGGYFSVLWHKAPIVHKVVWVISSVGGLVLGVTVEDRFSLLIDWMGIYFG